MFMKDWACFLFLDPQNEIGPSIASLGVLNSFVLLVYIVTLVLVFCLCPSSVRVVATFPGTVVILTKYKLFPFYMHIRVYCGLLGCDTVCNVIGRYR
jgi:hypothetical protein